MQKGMIRPGLWMMALAALGMGIGPASAAVEFPAERNLVGPGEYYHLETFGHWHAQCEKHENAEDSCEAATLLEDIEAGLRFELAVEPYLSLKPFQADVDVLPRALISALPLSSSPHYAAYSVAITEVDGEPFDGFWCKLTEPDQCNRGPEVILDDLDTLLKARVVEVSVFNSDATPDNYELVAQFEVDFQPFSKALGSALDFNGKVHGFDPETFVDVTQMCTFDMAGRQVVQKRISYTYDEDFDAAVTSMREIMLGPKGRGDCPSYVTLAYLTPDMTHTQRDSYCLVYDKDAGQILGFTQGERDAYRICRGKKKSFCERVNASKETALAITGFGAGVVGGVTGVATATGTTVVAHSSGAWILTGSSGYVAGTLGTISTTAAGVLTAPVVVGAAVVSVVVVGGAVYACSHEG